MALIRLAYASEATFDASPTKSGVEPNVARILLTSRRNNPKKGLVGGLYYGDNRFFQYLEGEERAVHELYETIKKDTRHRNVKTLIDEPLKERTFKNWSMKYVPVAGDVAAFLKRQGLSEFNPYAFDREVCEQMIELIRKSSHDDKLINHSEARPTAAPEAPVSSGVRMGLILAGVVLLGAFVAGGMLLF
ncbi:MAG: BLUF domain-containing protein [Marinobacter sp.]|uniref:BLUF domain-containing protein n=1 Tax=Marinobacter sp. TaxID=50741 RepID=UPI00299D7838|nr:BLUF domain-containing protein [Marinobacter sp.]MDX1635131.1 BLUF domain-containing protein [Marinobacter sp.]